MSREQREALKQKLGQPIARGVRTADEMRAGFAAMMSTMRVTGGVRTKETSLGGRRTLHVAPETDPVRGAILYFHGGAYVVGSPETALSLTTALVARTRLPAFSVAYSLAPEHPFPAAIDDAVAAYRDLLARGLDAHSVVLAGDSAGGGVAMALAIAARDAGLPMPAGVVGFSGSYDMTRTGASMETKRGRDPYFTREGLEPTKQMYLAGQSAEHPWLSPALFGDLAGLPPLLLQVGTNEVLLDDSTRLAARAWAAELDVILDVTGNAPHVFQTFTGVLDEADEALDRAAAFIRQRVR